MQIVLEIFEQMWFRSKAEKYNDFRTFIMGIQNQPMFPNGVIYEGVDNTPRQYRGESGANDSIIPTHDNLFQLTKLMPQNPLTDALRDFRTYRPAHHSEWLSYVEKRANELEVLKFAMEDSVSTFLLISNLDKNRAFRTLHWDLTKAYIITKSKHPMATGGTPIISWLPN